MTTWTSGELTRIGDAEELQISSRRQDGTLRPSRTIWVVRVGDALYVRSVYGRASAWFKGAQAVHAGRIHAGGVEKDVDFVEMDDSVNDAIDGAYRTKYRRYAASIIESIMSVEARAATLKLTPR